MKRDARVTGLLQSLGLPNRSMLKTGTGAFDAPNLRSRVGCSMKIGGPFDFALTDKSFIGLRSNDRGTCAIIGFFSRPARDLVP